MDDVSQTDPFAPGAMLPDLAFTIEREQLIRFCGAADDYGNLHWDDLYMQRQGFGGVIVHGWLSCSVLMRVATDWEPLAGATFGDFTVRYLRPNYPGPALYRGRVKGVGRDEARRTIDLELWAEDCEGRRLADIALRAALPHSDH